MTRRFQDSIDVRVDGRRDGGADPGPDAPDPAGGRPVWFRWRGVPYTVIAVLSHWIEIGCWWNGQGPGSEYVVWRVEAARRRGPPGVYDLSRRTGDDRWFLTRSFD